MEKINSIYIVDDDPITVFGIRKILDNIVKCENIDAFGNGKLALESIIKALEEASEIPEVIFLDINMPIMDGWQFLQEFIKLPLKEKVRINIITSSIDSVDRENWEFYKTQTHHLVTFINKPLRSEELIKITKSA
ncbi:MAG: response regulator [Aurantibacter sp.]